MRAHHAQAATERSTVHPWRAQIEAWVTGDAQPTAIRQALTEEVHGLSGSLSAVKRLVRVDALVYRLFFHIDVMDPGPRRVDGRGRPQ